ncbi:MAG TPA: TRAP transporter large permease subunit, partial [Bauldia sp.]|nr:TRAP transporter large permease subunit [Bauldia sp.]
MIGTTLALLCIVLGLSIPVGIGLGLLGRALSGIYSPLPLSVALGELTWSTSNSFILVAVPLYIMLGEIVLRSGIAERVYNALRLAHALLKKDPQTTVTVFLMADAVVGAKAGQKTPDGYYNV